MTDFIGSARPAAVDPMDYTLAPGGGARILADYRPDSKTQVPAVSIVTPFHDPGPAFDGAVESVLSQTLQAWEWIIVDDGSTDPGSLDALERARLRDGRIRVIRHAENGGAGEARNTGFRAANARFVLQLDADDQIEPTAAEKWLWHLHTHPETAFVNGHTVCFGSLECVWTSGFQERDRFLDRNFVGGRGLVRRAVHADAGGYAADMPLALEDWDFWLRCASAGHWGTTLDEALDWQHRRGTNAQQWRHWDDGGRQDEARSAMRRRHADVVDRGIPAIPRNWPQPHQPLDLSAPCENLIRRDRRRLLLLVAWLELGGTDTFNLQLIDRLTEQGWQVTVISTLPATDSWRWEYLRRTPDVFMLHRFLPADRYPAFLKYVMTSRGYDCVLIAHSEAAYHLLPALRAWSPDSLYLDYLHILEPGWKSGGYPRMSARLHGQIDRTLVSSRHLARWLTDQAVDPARIEVLPTPVDTDRFRPDNGIRQAVRRRLGIDAGDVVVLFAGRLCHQKQPLLLVRVLERVWKGGTGFRVVIAGDGELRDDLEGAITAAGLASRAILLGAVANGDIADLMRASDIFFLPSEREGVALSVYEAMASGLAVVASDVGGQSELVTEGTGVLITPGEDDVAIERFAEALVRMIQSPTLRASIAGAARKRVSECFSSAELGMRLTNAIGRADTARNAAPRPPADPALAMAIAEQAVEYLRLDSVCDRLWNERQADVGRTPGVGSMVGRGTRSVILDRLIVLYGKLRSLADGWRRNGSSVRD